ncbi:hypothetical protein SK128_001038, partial [Halocaridina rubra]
MRHIRNDFTCFFSLNLARIVQFSSKIYLLGKRLSQYEQPLLGYYFSDDAEQLLSGFISVEGGHIKQGESEDIDQGLAADFDDSLSGLGVDISTASYNMSEALLALPSVPLLKHEIDKHSYSSSNPATFDDSSQSNTTDRLFKLLSSDSLQDAPPSMHQLLQQHLPAGGNQGVAGHSVSQGPPGASSLSANNHSSFQSPSVEGNVESIGLQPSGMSYEDSRFQYILGAATSIATKMNEESLSYLNQGQSYEIKVKKLGDLTG